MNRLKTGDVKNEQTMTRSGPGYRMKNNYNAVVQVRDVHKSFKALKAINGVNLSIYEGQYVALLGPNGAGKTTLVEMIEGIQKPDVGDILLLGKHWKGNEDALHHEIGISLQETRFIGKLNVRETLKLFAGFYDLGEERVNEVINLIGLADKRSAYVVNLSGGQRQRLALGIALLNHPGILILDEPTTGLDPNARREVWKILYRLKQNARTSLVLTTHYMEEAEQLCDYIVILDKGRILKEGTLDQLLDEESGQKIVEFSFEESNRTQSVFDQQSSFSVHWDAMNGKGLLTLDDMEKDLPDFLDYIKQKNLRLKRLECRRKTLDDLFTTLTGRRLDE